jgi:hypothetical protein
LKSFAATDRPKPFVLLLHTVVHESFFTVVTLELKYTNRVYSVLK